MEVWQFFSMVCTIAVSYYFFHKDVKSEMKEFKIEMAKMNEHHREDMKNMDSKWERLFENFFTHNQKKS